MIGTDVNGLEDVNLSNLQDNQILMWDEDTNTWLNIDANVNVVYAPAGFLTAFDNTDLDVNGILNVVHDSNREYPTVTVYDNNALIMLPDDVEYIDLNTIDVNLLSQAPIPGTWHLRVETNEGGDFTEADGNGLYIKTDGSSVCSASIPFAEGLTAGSTFIVDTGNNQIEIPPGGLGTPGVIFTTDSDTGFGLSTVNTIGFHTGGTENAYLTSAKFQTIVPVFINNKLNLFQITEPSPPDSNYLTVYVEGIRGFPFLKYLDSTGMKRELVRDSMILVKNVRGTTIAANRIVYKTGWEGDVPTVDLAKADSTATMPAIGVTIEAIADGDYGRVMQVGLLENINTSSVGDGNTLYVSDVTAGVLTITAPITPHLTQEIGSVLVSDAVVGKLQIIARGITGDEYGTAQNAFVIGDGLTGSKTLTFNSAIDLNITWDENQLNIPSVVFIDGNVDNNISANIRLQAYYTKLGLPPFSRGGSKIIFLSGNPNQPLGDEEMGSIRYKDEGPNQGLILSSEEGISLLAGSSSDAITVSGTLKFGDGIFVGYGSGVGETPDFQQGYVAASQGLVFRANTGVGLSPVAFIFNDTSKDTDFIVNTDTVSSAFFIDAGTDIASFDIDVNAKQNLNVDGNLSYVGAYGELYQNNLETLITIPDINVFHEISGNTAGNISNFTSNDTNLISIIAGHYLVNYSVSFSGTANNEYNGAILLNGTEQAEGQSHRKIGTGGDIGSMGGTGIVNISADNNIGIGISNETAGNDATVEHFTFTLTYIGR